MVYTLGLVATRFGNLLLVPLYWSLLSPSEYGIIAVAAIFTEFLTAIMGFGLPESITRFYYEWDGEALKRHLGAIWMVAWGSSVIVAMLLMSIGDGLGLLITQVPFSPYLEIAIWIAVCNSAAQTPLFLLRTMEKPGFYIGASFLTFILNTVFSIVFVLSLPSDGSLAILGAQAIAGVIMMVIYTGGLLVWTTPNVRYRYWGVVLGFSLPLIPSKLIAATAGVVDRFLLEKFISLNDLGLYQVTIQFSRTLALVTNGLRTAWIPLQMRLLTERPDDGRQMVGRLAPYFIAVVLIAAIGLSTVLGDLVTILDIEEYLPVVIFLPLAVMPNAINGIVTIVIQGYIIAKKTQYAWIRTSTQLVTAIIANILLIPEFGIYGAFVASSLAMLAAGMVGYALSTHFFYIPFPWRKIFLIIAVAVSVIIVVMAIDLGLNGINLIFSIVMLLIYTGWVLVFPLEGSVWLRQRSQHMNRLFALIGISERSQHDTD